MGDGGYRKRPPSFLWNGGSCSCKIVFTVPLTNGHFNQALNTIIFVDILADYDAQKRLKLNALNRARCSWQRTRPLLSVIQHAISSLPVRVSAVLPTIVPVSDDSDVVINRLTRSPLYAISPSPPNLRVFRPVKEPTSLGWVACGLRCGRGLCGKLKSCCGVCPYVSIMVLSAFWRTWSVMAFTSTP